MVKSSRDRCQDFFHIKTASRDKIAPGLVSLQIDLTSDSINLQTVIGNREIYDITCRNRIYRKHFARRESDIYYSSPTFPLIHKIIRRNSQVFARKM